MFIKKIGFRSCFREKRDKSKLNVNKIKSLIIDHHEINKPFPNANSIINPKNDKASLYSAISMLIQGSGFDMRTLPAYVNFYGNGLTTRSKITPSHTVANDLFGTFLEVDYQESSPKIVLQYTGPTSKHLELSDISEKYKFKNCFLVKKSKPIELNT
mgnify:CR=1 FL=1